MRYWSLPKSTQKPGKHKACQSVVNLLDLDLVRMWDFAQLHPKNCEFKALGLEIVDIQNRIPNGQNSWPTVLLHTYIQSLWNLHSTAFLFKISACLRKSTASNNVQGLVQRPWRGGSGFAILQFRKPTQLFWWSTFLHRSLAVLLPPNFLGCLFCPIWFGR